LCACVCMCIYVHLDVYMYMYVCYMRGYCVRLRTHTLTHTSEVGHPSFDLGLIQHIALHYTREPVLAIRVSQVNCMVVFGFHFTCDKRTNNRLVDKEADAI